MTLRRIAPYVGLIGIAVFFSAYYVLAAPSAPPMVPDSFGYINFDADRPIGYPAFLFLIKLLTGSHDAVRSVQIVLFCTCTAALGITLLKHSGSALAAIAAELGILVHPGPIRLADLIISDSLSASVILLYAAALWGYVATPTTRRYGILCAVAALAITLRPVNVALLAPTALALFLVRGRAPAPMWQGGSLFAVISASGLLITPAAYWVIHGTPQTTSPLARALFQKVMFVTPASAAGGPAQCEARYIESITAPINGYLQTVPAEFQGLMRYRYSQLIRFSHVIPQLESRHQSLSNKQRNSILMCYTLARIAEDPASIVRQSWQEYWKLVSNYSFITREQRARYIAFLTLNPPILPPLSGVDSEQPSDFDPPEARSTAAIVALDAVQLAAVAFTLVGVLALIRPLLGGTTSTIWTVAGLTGLAVQAYLWITAFVEMAEARYLLPVWSLLWVSLIYAVLIAHRRWSPGRFSPDPG